MLREIRIKHGIRLQELATSARLSRVTVEKAERGQAVSSVSANRIVDALSRLIGQIYTIESLEIKISRREK